MADGKDKPRCSGKKAGGQPCRNAPIPGTTRCYHHSFKVPGRPTKLTDDVKQRILDAVLEGNYLETAAQAAGVSKTTLYRWLRRADDLEAQAEEHHDEDADGAFDVYSHVDPAEWLYLDFRHALKSAEAFAETELLRQVLRAGRGWQAFATVLERRHPGRWARNDRITVDDVGAAGTPVYVAPAEERRAEVLAILGGALHPPPGADTLDRENPPTS